MFGSSPPFEYERPFATFILPPLLRPFRSRKTFSSSRALSGDNVVAARHNSLSSGPRSWIRSSVASASSSWSSGSSSSSSSRSPPSLCSSPGSLATSPPDSFTHYYHRPSFAASLTAEPDHVDFADHADNSSAVSPGDNDHNLLERALPDTLRCVKCSTDVAFAAQIVSKGFTGRHGRAYLVSAPSTSAAHLFAPEISAAAAAALTSRSAKAADDGKDTQAARLANIRIGTPEHRQLVTGAHVVADISCAVCRTKLGWKYVDARDATQRYKIGKFILETVRVARCRSWENAAAFGEGLFQVDDDDDNDRNENDDFNFFGPHYGGSSAVVDPVGAARKLMARQDGNGSAHPGTMVEFDSDDDDECEEIFAGTWDADVVAKRRNKKLATLNKA